MESIRKMNATERSYRRQRLKNTHVDSTECLIKGNPKARQSVPTIGTVIHRCDY